MKLYTHLWLHQKGRYAIRVHLVLKSQKIRIYETYVYVNNFRCINSDSFSQRFISNNLLRN